MGTRRIHALLTIAATWVERMLVGQQTSQSSREGSRLEPRDKLGVLWCDEEQKKLRVQGMGLLIRGGQTLLMQDDGEQARHVLRSNAQVEHRRLPVT